MDECEACNAAPIAVDCGDDLLCDSKQRTMLSLNNKGMYNHGENRQNLHVLNLWPVKYHTKKNNCANPTPRTLSVEIYMSQQDYLKSACFYFVAIYISQQKTVPV